jgi:hypothetical protein
MAVYCDKGDHLLVFANYHELSWGRGNRLSRYWPLIALRVLSTDHLTYGTEDEIHRWVFTHDLLPAVERIIADRGTILQELTGLECERRVADVLACERRQLHDDQPAGSNGKVRPSLTHT